MDGLAVLAGGLIALAGGAAGNRLRRFGVNELLSAPTERIERLERSVKVLGDQSASFQEATAGDLADLQKHLSSAVTVLDRLNPVELVTRLGIVEQSWTAANKDLRRSLDEQRIKLADLEAKDAELASGLEEQRATLQQAIDGMAQVSMAQDQLTVGLDARLAQLQGAIEQAQQQTAQRRVQLGQVIAPQQSAGVVAAMDPASLRSSGSVPLASPMAQLEELGRATAAAQAEFAARQREAAAAAFAQPAGGGR